MRNNTTNRDYDVVLYGASGFTGKQTVQYFARHAPPTLRWAIAGRNRAKLEEVKVEFGVSVDILVADCQDQPAVDAIVSRTRVLLSTAGPFAIHGNAIVDACVRFQTHYADITGETTWVRELIARHHPQATADGTRIIPFCGFDSIPSDLGAYLIVRHMQQALGVSCREVKAYFQMRGGVNGGTLATVFNVAEAGQTAQVRDPFLLNPILPDSAGAHSTSEIERSRDPAAPLYDKDLGAWVGPFFMGPINTRVVRRSRALFDQWRQPYGSDFAYQEYMKFDGPLGWIEATGVAAGSALFEIALRMPLRGVMQSLLPQPGSGPSEKTMDGGWFRCELLGVTDDGRKVRGMIRDQGDPGNRATVKFLCESALCLALQADELPGGSQRGGILTPATGLGDVLADRLRAAGMILEIEEIGR